MNPDEALAYHQDVQLEFAATMSHVLGREGSAANLFDATILQAYLPQEVAAASLAGHELELPADLTVYLLIWVRGYTHGKTSSFAKRLFSSRERTLNRVHAEMCLYVMPKLREISEPELSELQRAFTARYSEHFKALKRP